MIYAASLFAFLSFFSLGLALGNKKKKEKINVARRLGQVIEEDSPTGIRQVELKQPFAERVIKPFLASFSSICTRLLPGSLHHNLAPKLQKAGNPGNLSAGEFLALKLFLSILLALPVVIIPGRFSWQVIIIIAAGWFIPDLYLQNLIKKRQEEIQKTMPDILDLLTVSVEAGLGFDGALAKVVEKVQGNIIAEEFRRVLKEIGMGKVRKAALKDMANRLAHEDVTTFIGSIIQAEQLGISFSRVLRLQSEQMRYKRKQRVEEQAMKVPVKMLIPLVFFIFPTIFIVLLGPAAIKIFTTLLQ